MTETLPICTHCDSPDTVWKAIAREWECNACLRRFEAPPPADLPDPLAAVEDECARRARVLAKSSAWVSPIIHAWPAPIAHTYALLRRLLHDGQVDASGLVLKDLLELLARFSALALGAGLRRWGTDTQEREVLTELFGKPLSMGDWMRLADTWAREVMAAKLPLARLAPMAALWRSTRGKQTQFGGWMFEQVQWRNEAIGHGVRGADLGPMMADLEKMLSDTDHGLHAVMEPYAHLWEDMKLVDANERALMGSQAVVDEEHERSHLLDAAQSLRLRGKDWELDLSPFLSARRCQVCGKSETFHYDSTDARRRVPDFRLLNYESGHAYRASLLLDRKLQACFNAVRPVDTVEASDGFDADALPVEIAQLLDAQSVERGYRSPGYLRQPLQAFIEQRREAGLGGVYWLRAPAHVGKSTFVRGLDPQYRVIYKEEPLEAGLAVVVFYIRREYQFHVAQFAEQLRERLKVAYGLQAQNKPLPSLDLELPGPQAFATFLGAFQELGHKPLLVIIDGLDELAQVSPSIADYLPGPEDLPAKVFVLLTSRPQADLAPWLTPRLERLRTASGREIGLDDADYVGLMRAYAEKGLEAGRSRLKGQATRDRVPQFSDALMAQLLQASDARFLYLHFLVDRLADGDLPADAVQDLPRPEQLVPQYLRAILNRYANTAQANLVQRTLHVLAITERAFELHQQAMSVLVRQPWRGLPMSLLSLFVEGAPQVTPRLASCLYLLKPLLGTWRSDGDARYRLGIKGLDDVVRSLDQQAYAQMAQRLVVQLLEDVSLSSSSDGARSAELDWVACHLDGIYDILDASAREDLRTHHAPALVLLNELRQRADAAAEGLRYTEALGALASAEGVCRLLAAPAELDADIGSQILQPWLEILNARGVAESASGDRVRALTSYGRAIALWTELQAQLGAQFTPDMQKGLAKVYCNRGNALSDQGDQEKALEDYERAIALWEDLKARPGELFMRDVQNGLARVYACRGGALSAQGDQKKALQDYERAIALGTELQARLGAQFTPDMQDSLATVYCAQGDALFDPRDEAPDQRKALEAYACAIDLWEDLKARLDEKFTPYMQQGLAGVYACRGTALSAQGALGDREKALEDYARVIALWEELKARLGAQFTPDMQSALASVYGNQAITFYDNGQWEPALASYGSAIALREELREQLGEQFTPDMQNGLASAYCNRGSALSAQGDEKKALKDYGLAISLWEELKARLGAQFTPDMQGRLAQAIRRQASSVRARKMNLNSRRRPLAP